VGDPPRRYRGAALEHSGFPLAVRIAPDIHVPCVLVQDCPSLPMYAALYGAVQCFQYLQRFGVGCFVAKDNKCRVLADFAVAGGSLTIVRIVEAVKCSFGASPQIAVAFHRGAILLHLLRTQEVALGEPDRLGKTVITAAAAANNMSALVFCLSLRVPVKTTEAFGWTALHCAAERGNLDACMLVLAVRHSNPNTRDTWGMIVLHLATDRLRVDVVEYFLKVKQGLVDAVTSEGQTAFHIAADSGCLDILEPFVASPRVNVNAQDSRGRTGLHLAVRRGSVPMIARILHRPDLNLGLTTNRGRTAWMVALKRNNQAVLGLGSEYGRVRAEKCAVA
jgi:ankyrin repeat protein